MEVGLTWGKERGVRQFFPLMIKTISQSCRQPASVLPSLAGYAVWLSLRTQRELI
jgi:hypothetical protein